MTSQDVGATPVPDGDAHARRRRTLAQRGREELARASEVRLTRRDSLLVGIATGVIAAGIKAGLNEVAGAETGYVVMVAAALLAAWLGGVWAGVAAIVVATILNAALFLDLAPDAAWDRATWIRQITFIVTSGVGVVLVASRRASRDRLADALEEIATLADAIETRDRRLELMLSASGTGFWEWDVATGDLLWSDAIFEQHGLTPGGAPPAFPEYLETIHPDDRDRFGEAIQRALDDRGTFDLEFRVLWPDGSVHWTRGSGRAFFDAAGRPRRMIGTGQDITQRKVLEAERDELLVEERQAQEFREAFIDVISHELRTPITTILGTTELLSKPGRIEDPEVRATLLADTRAESERLYRLVEDLLVLGRIERDRLVVDSEPLHLGRLLRQAIARSASDLPSIRIELEVPDDVPIVAGEATYVEQILRNLLENAAKYAPVGSEVTVAVIPAADQVSIEVVDEGPGIPDESIPHVFELFYRDPSVLRTTSGSGIGLFVCRRLAEAMGGHLSVSRPPEGGSVFVFDLPILRSDPDEVPTGDSVAFGRTH